VVPFESLSKVSYLPSIVTMAVPVAILEILSVKECPGMVWYGMVWYGIEMFNVPPDTL